MPDTRLAVSCDDCGRRYLTAEHLAAHQERGHVTRQEREESAIEQAADAVAARVGQLPAGTVVLVAEVSQQCGISKKMAAQVLAALAAQKRLTKACGWFVVAPSVPAARPLAGCGAVAGAGIARRGADIARAGLTRTRASGVPVPTS